MYSPDEPESLASKTEIESLPSPASPVPSEEKETASFSSHAFLAKQEVFFAKESELVILSAIISSHPQKSLEIFSQLQKEHFSIEKHQYLFQEAKRLYQKYGYVDIAMILQELSLPTSNPQEKVLFQEWVGNLDSLGYLDPHLDTHLDILQQKYLNRMFYKTLQDLGKKLLAGNDIQTLFTELSTQIYENIGSKNHQHILKMAEAMQEAIALLENPTQNESILTGIPSFDSLLHGFQKGQLIILAARPSVGKSALALQIGSHAALQNKTVLFLSLEMSSVSHAQRLLASKTSFKLSQLRFGTLPPSSIEKLNHLIQVWQDKNLFLDDRAHNSLQAILLEIKKFHFRFGLDFVIIDYLQIIPSAPEIPRYLAIAQMTRAFKLLAKELEIPILLLSQVSRDVEKSGISSPRLSDLRDSGAIEQDADIVLFLYPEEDAPSGDMTHLQLRIAKNRNGEIGAIPLIFQKSSLLFYTQETHLD